MDSFSIYTILIGVIIVLAMVLAYFKTEDPFHPAIIIGAQLLFLYCWLPYITIKEFGLSNQYINAQKSGYVQLVNLIGIISLLSGLLWKVRRKPARPIYNLLKGGTLQIRLLKLSKFFGLLGTSAFFFIVFTSGGFAKVYGHAYGGGWHPLGYLRELYLFTIPAIIFYFLAIAFRRLKGRDFFWLMTFSAPLLIHGLLGARRGPTFMIIITLFLSYYFSRTRRPPLLLVLKGGAILGFFLLFLVSNRQQIYIGSELNIENRPTSIFMVPQNNEFFYGAATILNANHFNTFHWGKRYLTVMFIRPIPRAIWPDKYDDASRWFNIPNIEENLGTGNEDFIFSMGWRGSTGAAPGIIADTWLEFWKGSTIFLFLIGFSFNFVWYRSCLIGGVWSVVYIIMASLSAYLVMQTFEAMIFRFLFLAIPTWMIMGAGKYKLNISYKQLFRELPEENQIV